MPSALLKFWKSFLVDYMCWYSNRFIESSCKTHITCKQCSKSMWLPASKAEKYIFCSKSCRKLFSDLSIKSRSRKCQLCESVFSPRQYQIDTGKGLFCSNKCSLVKIIEMAHTDKANEKRVATLKERKAIAEKNGVDYAWRSGEKNKLWNGGKDATLKSGLESGKLAENTRKYRQKNVKTYRAHSAAGHAIRTGKIIRMPCEICGNEKSHAHHDDYSKPLNVRFLCAKHHKEWHKHNKPEGL